MQPVPLCFAVAICVSITGLAAGASAEVLSSSSYQQVAGTFSSASAARLDSSAPSPTLLGTGTTIGSGSPTQLSGSTNSLESLASGFWPIVAGGFTSLDLDLDGIQAFLDPDDDNDGLLDEVETGTGFFVSASDTGSSPNDADTDLDGVSDGVEVANGFDPNDPLSFPPPPAAVPTLSPSGWMLLVLGISLASLPIRRLFRVRRIS